MWISVIVEEATRRGEEGALAIEIDRSTFHDNAGMIYRQIQGLADQVGSHRPARKGGYLFPRHYIPVDDYLFDVRARIDEKCRAMVPAPGIIRGMQEEFHPVRVHACRIKIAQGKIPCCLVVYVDADLLAQGKLFNKAAIIRINDWILPGQEASLCGQLSQVASCGANSAGKKYPC